jgi:hypothetical protein
MAMVTSWRTYKNEPDWIIPICGALLFISPWASSPNGSTGWRSLSRDEFEPRRPAVRPNDAGVPSRIAAVRLADSQLEGLRQEVEAVGDEARARFRNVAHRHVER